MGKQYSDILYYECMCDNEAFYIAFGKNIRKYTY